MKKTKTSKGFRLYEFKDCYGGKCSLQMSSREEDPRIWLGLDSYPDQVNIGRMHLNRKTAAKLALKLAAFAESGELV